MNRVIFGLLSNIIYVIWAITIIFYMDIGFPYGISLWILSIALFLPNFLGVTFTNFWYDIVYRFVAWAKQFSEEYHDAIGDYGDNKARAFKVFMVFYITSFVLLALSSLFILVLKI